MDVKELVALLLVIVGLVLVVTGLHKLPDAVVKAQGVGSLPFKILLQSQVGIGVTLILIGAGMLAPQILGGAN